MILIFSVLISALIFLFLSYTYIDTDMYEKHSMLFFLLNSAAGMIVFIIVSYLFITFMLMGKLYV